MDNNSILRRLRYILDFGDSSMMDTFELADHEVTRELLSNWLKAEEHAEFVEMSDYQLAVFLNGLIILKRGKKDDVIPEAEKELNNNAILHKIKIALTLKSDDILEAFQIAGIKISATELSAFLRKSSHRHFKELNNQYLRKFLSGLQKKIRKTEE